ncbi:DNA helicase [Frankia sp. Hr75.2]|nr:DNA helicase [Frankia sp. Hr75.2]
MWAAWQHFDRDLRASGRWTHEMICVEAACLLEQRPQRPYRHVVIDEAQDLSPVQWRFLRAAVAPGADDIFVAGDASQRIHHNRVSLRELGIPVVVVGTMHRMKGLEFRCLAVLGVGERQVPASSAVTPAGEDGIAHAQDVQRERCLLFVACTRAREELSVSWHGPQSPFLAPFDPAIRPV